jgi:hypothetical protein
MKPSCSKNCLLSLSCMSFIGTLSFIYFLCLLFVIQLFGGLLVYCFFFFLFKKISFSLQTLSNIYKHNIYKIIVKVTILTVLIDHFFYFLKVKMENPLVIYCIYLSLAIRALRLDPPLPQSLELY